MWQFIKEIVAAPAFYVLALLLAFGLYAVNWRRVPVKETTLDEHEDSISKI